MQSMTIYKQSADVNGHIQAIGRLKQYKDTSNWQIQPMGRYN